MKLNLLKKHFLITAVSIALALIALMLIVASIQIDYIKKDKLTMLENSAISISEALKQPTSAFDYYSVIERTGNAYFSEQHTVFFVTKGGYTYFCTDDNYGGYDCSHRQNSVSKEIMKNVELYDIYSEFDRFGGMYAEDTFTAGAQLLDATNKMKGAVFVSMSTDSYSALVHDMVTTFIVSGAIILIVLFIIIYFLSSRISKPLNEMSIVAKSIASGDFSARVKHTSNDEIGELASSFNDMCFAMESLDKVRSDFIANVSHEFKTPMTVIGGYIDGIIDGTISPEDQNVYLEIVSNEVKRLNIMVNSMLQLSKLAIGKDRLKYETHDLAEVILNIFLSFEEKIIKKEIDVYGLESLGTMNIECDLDLIYNAIYNLIDNAVKYTPNVGYISVSKRESVSAISIYIKNSGKGIKESELPHVFERFYKTDKSRSVDKSGTGLGLYIVKNVINHHGGEVIARSKEGAYTEFEINLPKKQS